jgi:DNA topoisomerase-1
MLEIRDEAQAELRDEVASLKPEEAAVLALLKARLDRTLADDLKDSLAAVKRRPRKRETTAAL